MKVKVLFFGLLKEIVGKPEEEFILDEGSSIGRLYQFYAVRFPRLAEHSSTLLFSRNREFASRSELLQEGDEVAFLPPVSGGCADDQDETPGTDYACWLTRQVISAQTLVEELKQGTDGAVVVFEGIVRNQSGGRATLFLEYEAYEPMALLKMREILAEVKHKFDVDRVGMVHRLGRLEIGEASIVIVITSAHRGPAFEACHYAIDHLKRIVPIWKKEFFADGAVWVESEQDRCIEVSP
ncbi:MAG: molybdenum cofactor biosynthesis protein MoaE [Acidobacteria bacterium]|nr:molybdenum cofactor biosynthesis protein MoaE [Acidobacteriota bacterium]